MSAYPAIGILTAVDRAVSLLQVNVLHVDQTVTDHIDRGLRLFQDQVSNERVVGSIGWMHLDEDHLTVNGTKSFYLNLDGTTNLTIYCVLRRGFTLNYPHQIQFADSIFPDRWQDQMRGAGVDERVTTEALRRIPRVLDFDRGNDSLHETRLSFFCTGFGASFSRGFKTLVVSGFRLRVKLRRTTVALAEAVSRTCGFLKPPVASLPVLEGRMTSQGHPARNALTTARKT